MWKRLFAALDEEFCVRTQIKKMWFEKAQKVSRIRRAAEAKYAAMAGTAEKLEATLKKLKGTAQTCQWSRDQLHRSVEKDKVSDRAAIVMFVCVDGRGRGRGRRHLWEFFTGGCRANPRCSGGLVGKLM